MKLSGGNSFSGFSRVVQAFPLSLWCRFFFNCKISSFSGFHDVECITRRCRICYINIVYMKKIIIAIDGHSSSGKSTMAKNLARRCVIHISTLVRCIVPWRSLSSQRFDHGWKGGWGGFEKRTSFIGYLIQTRCGDLSSRYPLNGEVIEKGDQRHERIRECQHDCHARFCPSLRWLRNSRRWC